MSRPRSFTAIALTTLLVACQPVRTRPSTVPPAAPPAPAWRGIAILDEPALAPREGVLEVVLVALGDNDFKVLAHAEFAVRASARIDFALPIQTALETTSTRVGWRVWLRDTSGRLRYASEHVVVANRDNMASIPLRKIPLR